MSISTSALLIAGIVVGLLLAGFANHWYLAKNKAGCIAYPLQFFGIATAVFCGTAIAAGGPSVWFGWRLLGACFIGVFSCIGMRRAHLILRKRDTSLG